MLMDNLEELARRLQAAAGENLKAVVLYGSAARGDFHAGHSDVNTLCVLFRVDGAELQKLSPVVEWWMRAGHRPPVVFTEDELSRSADVFAIELMDIKRHHRMLLGEDIFDRLEVPKAALEAQVERELRTKVAQLRERYFAARRKNKDLLRLMTVSVSSTLAIFRHTLAVLGESAPPQGEEAVDGIAALMGFDAKPFHTLLALRQGKIKDREIDVETTFAGYLAAVTRAAEEFDRRLESKTRKQRHEEQA